MELNTEQLTGARLQGMLKLVEARDGVDKEILDLTTQRAEIDTKVATLNERRIDLSKQIDQAAGADAPTAASTTSHNGNGHSGKAAHTPARIKGKSKKGAKATKKGRGPGKRLATGTVGETILEVLREAGAKGASIKDICAKFDLREDTVGKWLQLTLKDNKSGIKRPSRGQYVLSETASK